jgi:hypothetical protein
VIESKKFKENGKEETVLAINVVHLQVINVGHQLVMASCHGR